MSLCLGLLVDSTSMVLPYDLLPPDLKQVLHPVLTFSKVPQVISLHPLQTSFIQTWLAGNFSALLNTNSYKKIIHFYKLLIKNIRFFKLKTLPVCLYKETTISLRRINPFNASIGITQNAPNYGFLVEGLISLSNPNPPLNTNSYKKIIRFYKFIEFPRTFSVCYASNVTLNCHSFRRLCIFSPFLGG